MVPDDSFLVHSKKLFEPARIGSRGSPGRLPKTCSSLTCKLIECIEALCDVVAIHCHAGMTCIAMGGVGWTFALAIGGRVDRGLAESWAGACSLSTAGKSEFKS